jgi:hypothetical protein
MMSFSELPDPKKGREIFKYLLGPLWGPRVFRLTLWVVVPLVVLALIITQGSTVFHGVKTVYSTVSEWLRPRELIPGPDTSNITILSTVWTVDPPPDEFGINVSYRNTGAIPAVSPFVQFLFVGTAVADPIPNLDRASMVLVDELIADRKVARTDEMAPTAGRYFTVRGSKDMYENNKKKQNNLYLLFFIGYKDRTLPNGTWWITEACWRIWPNDSLERCSVHNRQAYAHD